MTTTTKPAEGLPALIEKMEPEFKKVLGNMVPSDRFTRIARSLVQGSPDVAGLDRASLFKAIMQAAQDGLVLDGKEAAIIPFKGKATYIPMVAGLVKRMRQHSEFANLSHGIIYQRELDEGRIEYVKGDDERLIHNPIMFGDRGEPIGAYAILTTKDGQKFRAVLRKEEIEKRLAVGQASSQKAQWREEFWIKTVIKNLYKMAPNSGDESGVLDQVFSRDDDDAGDDEPAPAPAKPVNRAAAAVKAATPQVVDAEIVPDEIPLDDAELPM